MKEVIGEKIRGIFREIFALVLNEIAGGTPAEFLREFSKKCSIFMKNS